MSHARQQIRDDIVTLVTGLSSTGARVYTTRRLQRIVDEHNTPCLLVYFPRGDTETSDHDGESRLHRMCRIAVKPVAVEADDVDDTLNDMAVEIETVITTQLSGTVDFCVLVESNFEGEDELGRAEVGALEMIFEVEYRTAFQAPETLI